jgi:hypothetical protein
MKVEKFPGNGRGFYMERGFHREGPPVVYVVCYKNTARLFTEPRMILKWLKWGKGTPSRQQLEEFLGTQAPKEVDPQENTKMVT